MKKQIYLIFVIYMFGLITAQSDNECITPNQETGVCLSILKCPVLQATIMEHRKKAEYYNLLKASFCGYEGRSPKVCCPLDKPIKETEVHVQSTGEISSSLLPSKATCGISQVNRDRIIGGTPSKLGAWPWMAALGYRTLNGYGTLQWSCGGSLITEKHVITAAHCTQTNDQKLILVRLGELNLNDAINDGAHPQDIPIESIISHNYDTQKLVNDIAILKLKNKVIFSKFIQPICLLDTVAMKTIDFTKSMPYVAGWGTVYANANNDLKYPRETALMEVRVPTVNTTMCKYIYKTHYNTIDDTVICAGYPKGGKDSCRGDSGGPMMWPIKNQYYLMGIVSYGTDICGRPGYPAIYTSVPSFINWIEGKLRQ